MDIHTIIVPVDGSDYSTRATEYAADLAGLTEAEIVLIHCHKPFPTLLGEPYQQKAVNRIIKQSNELLDPYRKMLREKGIPFTERVMEGPPRDAISNVARIINCDLIVIGSRGLSDLQGLFLGSVTHRVLRSAPCPVTVIR